MHILDKPPFVKFCESIPVNGIGRDGKIGSIRTPFQGQGKKFTELQREAEAGPEDCTPLTFYSPIHLANSHLCLLEMNDSERVFRHYDSLAATATINGTEWTSIGALVEAQSFSWMLRP